MMPHRPTVWLVLVVFVLRILVSSQPLLVPWAVVFSMYAYLSLIYIPEVKKVLKTICCQPYGYWQIDAIETTMF